MQLNFTKHNQDLSAKPLLALAYQPNQCLLPYLSIVTAVKHPYNMPGTSSIHWLIKNTPEIQDSWLKQHQHRHLTLTKHSQLFSVKPNLAQSYPYLPTKPMPMTQPKHCHCCQAPQQHAWNIKHPQAPQQHQSLAADSHRSQPRKRLSQR